MIKQYRDQIQIQLIMLNALRERKTITGVMFDLRTSLPSTRLHIRLGFKYGLIYQDSKFYYINDKGRKLLELLGDGKE